MQAVAIVSGGVDSVTLAYHLREEGYDLHLLAFDYGQRHLKELECAQHIAGLLDARYDRVDLTSITHLLAGSALTDTAVDVPDGHYAADNMAVTVVPNRNAIMLSIAYGVAVAEGADLVAAGIHAGDHHIYPDCRPSFARAFDTLSFIANEGHAKSNLRFEAPFVHWTKAEIVARGGALGVPYEHTWSCYKGGALHCGTCGTCVERREAFQLADMPDPTVYAR